MLSKLLRKRAARFLSLVELGRQREEREGRRRKGCARPGKPTLTDSADNQIEEGEKETEAVFGSDE